MAATQYRTLKTLGGNYNDVLNKTVEILTDLVSHSGNNWPVDLAISNLGMVNGKMYFDLTDEIPGGPEMLEYYEVESLA